LAKRGAPPGSRNAAKVKKVEEVVAEIKGDNVTFFRGNQAEYLTRRIARDLGGAW